MNDFPYSVNHNNLSNMNNINQSNNNNNNNNNITNHYPKSDERRAWTREEDELVIQLVNKYGTKKWSLVGSCMIGRTGKQCKYDMPFNKLEIVYYAW